MFIVLVSGGAGRPVSDPKPLDAMLAPKPSAIVQ